MSQYKATDDSIFALGADSRPIIVSKVPKHGFDEIRVSRVSKDGKLVLKDKTGTALQSAFGDSTYRWDGKTPLTNVLQKYSFANRGFVGGQTDTGSKTTYQNISVTGSDAWKRLTPSPASKAKPAKPAGSLQQQLAALQSQMDRLSSPPSTGKGKAKAKTPPSATASAMAKAKAKAKGKGKAKTPPSATAKGKGKAKTPPSATAKGKGKGKAKDDSGSPISFTVTAKDRHELEGKLQVLLSQLEEGRTKKRKTPATAEAVSAAAAAAAASPAPKKRKASPAKAALARSPIVAAAAEALEEGEIREALSLLQTVPEPVEQDLTTENQIHESFTAGKSVVAAHYTKVTDDMPDAKMTVKQLRYDLIHHMYSEDELRELADGAGIQHARITKMQTLRERLAQHFAELLPERDDA